VLLATLGATIGIAAADSEARAASANQARSTQSPSAHTTPAKPTETASLSPSASASPTEATRKVRVVSPPFLLSRAKTNDNSLKRSASQYLTLTPPDGATKVTGVYGSNAHHNVVIMLAVGGVTNSDPDQFLDAWVASAYPEVTFHDVAPGTRGGKARCGPADTETTAVTLCLWADYEAFGFFYFVYDDTRLGETLLPTARSQVERVN
jgi:hypothetical protein